MDFDFVTYFGHFWLGWGMIAHCLSVGIPICLKGIFVLFYPKIHVSPCGYFLAPQITSHLLGCSQERAAGVDISNFDADSLLDLELDSSRKGKYIVSKAYLSLP